MKNAFTQEVNQLLVKLGLHPNAADLLDRFVIIVIILLIAWLADLFCRFVIVGGIGHIIKHTKAKWDDVLLHPQVLRKLTYLIPVLIVYMLLPLALSDKAEILGWLRKLCIIYGIVVVLVFINIFLKVLFGIFRNQEAFRDKPLKGLVQIMQVGLVCIGIILTISTLLNISPLHLLAGLGASAAILMLIFKDSILGFVSGIQLSINDMLRAGDWISMPKYDVDGTVLDVSLTTVKIENFDNTVTTLPPYTLTSDSFKNWRAMSESGGRRVMRSVNIDINSVRFCTPAMPQKPRSGQPRPHMHGAAIAAHRNRYPDAALFLLKYQGVGRLRRCTGRRIRPCNERYPRIRPLYLPGLFWTRPATIHLRHGFRNRPRPVPEQHTVIRSDDGRPDRFFRNFTRRNIPTCAAGNEIFLPVRSLSRTDLKPE